MSLNPAIDRNAYNVSTGRTDLTEAERQYVLAVARGEGTYGLGWKVGEGAGSHNWGAVQGQGPAGSFIHIDYHADGSPYFWPYKAYHNDFEGFSDMANNLLKPNVKAAIKQGSLRKAVFAQHDNKYFELAPEKYLQAVMRNYNELTTNLGWPRLLTEKGHSFWTSFLLAMGVIGGASYALHRSLKHGQE